MDLQLSLHLCFVGLGFERTLETDWAGLEIGLGQVGVHAVRLCFLNLYREGIVGLEGCDGAGRGGQSVSVMTRGERTSCRVGMGCVFASRLVWLDVVMQW